MSRLSTAVVMALLCSHFALALPAPIRAGADVQPHPATVTPHDDLLSQTTLSQTAQKVTPPGNVLSDITNGKSGAQDSFPHDALKNGASDKGPDSKDSAKDKGSSLFVSCCIDLSNIYNVLFLQFRKRSTMLHMTVVAALVKAIRRSPPTSSSKLASIRGSGPLTVTIVIAMSFTA